MVSATAGAGCRAPLDGAVPVLPGPGRVPACVISTHSSKRAADAAPEMTLTPLTPDIHPRRRQPVAAESPDRCFDGVGGLIVFKIRVPPWARVATKPARAAPVEKIGAGMRQNHCPGASSYGRR